MSDAVIPVSSHSPSEMPDKYVNAATEIRELLNNHWLRHLWWSRCLQNYNASANFLLQTMMTPYSIQYSGIPLFQSLKRKVEKRNLTRIVSFLMRMISAFEAFYENDD